MKKAVGTNIYLLLLLKEYMTVFENQCYLF